MVKTRSCLGFRQQSNLLEVARYVAVKLDEFEGGNWLCLILPGEIEPGLSYSMYKALQICFMKESIEYVILVV